MFFAGIAPSGERKSPTFRAMTRPLENWEEMQIPAWEEQFRKAKAKNTAVDSYISTAKALAKKDEHSLEQISGELEKLEAERVPEPPRPSLFTTDATEQRLVQKMAARGGAYAVMSGEGRSVFDSILGKYSGEGRTGDSVYFAGISGDTITRDRVGKEAGPEEVVMRRPCLNVCVMVQPDKYLEVAGNSTLRQSGLLARISPVWLAQKRERESRPTTNRIYAKRNWRVTNPWCSRCWIPDSPCTKRRASQGRTKPGCRQRQPRRGESFITPLNRSWLRAGNWKT